jgi:inner membrane protein
MDPTTPETSHTTTTATTHDTPIPSLFGWLGRLRESPLVRLSFVCILVMFLQIPVALIDHTVDERRSTRAEALSEVTATWGGAQELIGPILTIPSIERWTDSDHVARERTVQRRFLPQSVTYEGHVATEVRRRGIFDVPLYVTTLRIRGAFVVPEEQAFNAQPADILWKRAGIGLGVAEPRAIRTASPLTLGETKIPLEPGPGSTGLLPAGLHVELGALPPGAALKPGATVPFSLELVLAGSGRLSFVPVGAETLVKLASPWRDPSFDGSYLPLERQVDKTGFVATWRILHLGRNFPSTWADDEVNHGRLRESAFGVSLLSPVDAYRTTDRAVKYQLLFLGLTFVAFMLFEMLSGLRIHPIQYLLVGLGLCMFYLLLLSLSEHLGFGRAYVMAAAATMGMVTAYVRYVLASSVRAATIGGMLAALYGFLFVLLQIQDYALLVGSVGLFLVLAAIMGLTRRVNWYELRPPHQPA